MDSTHRVKEKPILSVPPEALTGILPDEYAAVDGPEAVDGLEVV